MGGKKEGDFTDYFYQDYTRPGPDVKPVFQDSSDLVSIIIQKLQFSVKHSFRIVNPYFCVKLQRKNGFTVFCWSVPHKTRSWFKTTFPKLLRSDLDFAKEATNSFTHIFDLWNHNSMCENEKIKGNFTAFFSPVQTILHVVLIWFCELAAFNCIFSKEWILLGVLQYVCRLS